MTSNRPDAHRVYSAKGYGGKLFNSLNSSHRSLELVLMARGLWKF